MNTQEAQFILSSYRHNGEDALDGRFTEALTLAAQDRKLGEWLAKERAKDAAFSAALETVPIPENLRMEIYHSLHGIQPERDEFDLAFSNAFNSLEVPSELRNQIMTSMGQEAHTAKKRKIKLTLQSAFLPLAALLVIGLITALLILPFGKNNNPSLQLSSTQPSSKNKNTQPKLAEKKSTAAIALVKTPKSNAKSIQLEVGAKIRKNIALTSLGSDESVDWLKKNQLPSIDLPERLKNLDCQGVTSIKLRNNVNASLIRFLTKDKKEVNLLMLDKKDVDKSNLLPSCSFGARNDSYYCPECEYAIARIQSGEVIVILLTQLDTESTSELF